MIVVAWIIKKENLFLLIKRRKVEGNLCWAFPAGIVEDFDSDSSSAVIREVKEETGVDIKIIRYIGSRVHPDTNKTISYWFWEYVSGKTFCGDKSEIKELGWYPVSKILKLITSDIYEPVLHILKNNS